MDEIDKEYPWMTEIQKAIAEIAVVYCLSSREILAFLTTTLPGQFVIAAVDEEKVLKTLVRIYDKYKAIKESDGLD